MSPVAALLASAVLAAATVPPAAEHEFHFVVLGDSQFHDPAAFNRLIDNVRSLRPAFVVQVGDMIEGYTDDADDISAQWQRFSNQIAPLSPVPFIPVPGNHDLYGGDKTATADVVQIYERKWGPAYRTFTYRNARIIVLNTDGVNAAKQIDDAQQQWLLNTLQKNKSPNVFVFMHRPPASLTNAETLHALFKEHGVGHVIYGHHHHYHFAERDGVRYIMTNATGDTGTRFDEAGSFDHLLQVAVRDDNVDISVIRADAFEPLEGVAPADNYDLFAIIRRLTPKTLSTRKAGNAHWTSIMQLRNPTERDLTLHLSCTSPDGRWQISPTRIPPIALAAQARQTVWLEWRYAANRPPEGAPTCHITVPFQTSQGTWLNQRIDVPVDGLNQTGLE